MNRNRVSWLVGLLKFAFLFPELSSKVFVLCLHVFSAGESLVKAFGSRLPHSKDGA